MAEQVQPVEDLPLEQLNLADQEEDELWVATTFAAVIVRVVRPDTNHVVEKRVENTKISSAIEDVLLDCNPSVPLTRPRLLSYQYHKSDKPVPNKWKKLDEDTEIDWLGRIPRIEVTIVPPLFDPSPFFDERRDDNGQLTGEGRVKRTIGADPYHNPPIRGYAMREPQVGSLEKMYKNLLPAPPGTRFLVVMPTGTGKTVVIALSPFILKAQKTLIVCPGKELTRQVGIVLLLGR